MTFEEFAALSEGARRKAFQDIYAGPDHPLFVAVKSAFLEAYPKCKEYATVFVGLASGLGPVNAITVAAAPRTGVRVPRSFMGLPVIRKFK
jgi:hypothetical protein